jgi:signal transduction histidine kinase/DNA-binding response OmpR family regulator
LDVSAKNSTQVFESFAHRYTSVLIWAITAGSGLAILLVLAFGYLALSEIRVRILTEKELKSAQEAALIASRLKSQFLATVSHEIRTPLNGIIGMSDLLKQKLENSEHRRYVEIICSSGDALLRMVNDILDFAKIEAGKTDFEFTEFSVLRLVEQVSELFAVKAQEKNIVLTTFVSADVPVNVSGDGSRISRILGNLVGNAVKFTPSGSVIVTARRVGVEREKVRIRFQVRDSGPGIPENIRELLFQPFNSFSAGGQKQEGSGLGLSISKQLVEQMGGEIGFTSDEAGSDFWFEIPLQATSQSVVGEMYSANKVQWKKWAIFSDAKDWAKSIEGYAREFNVQLRKLADISDIDSSDVCIFLASARSDVKKILSRIEQTGASAIVVTPKWTEDVSSEFRVPIVKGFLRPPFTREQFLKVMTQSTETKLVPLKTPKKAAGGLILLVEDNVTNQILAKAILEDLGYKVHTVANGEEALEALSRVNYDLILMDGQMPVMDGFEATKQIRLREAKAGTRIPIIAMTANATEADRQKCLSVGMDDFIAKPFKSAELFAKVERWLGRDHSGFDWEVLEELGRQTNAAVVEKLITSFLSTLPQTLAHVRSFMQQNNWEGVRKSAHHLKSSASSLGATRLAELCDQIENLVEADRSKAAQALVTDLLNCGSIVENELRVKRNA